LLQKSFDLDSHSTLAQLHKAVTASGLSHEQSAQVEQLLRKLSSIGAAYVRLSSDATQSTASQLPNPDSLDSEFESCLASICMLIGLPSQHLASIPVNCFAGSLTHDWWHNIVHSTSQISRAPETLMPEPRTERRCRVKVKIDGTSFIAHSYVVFRRCVYWRSEQGSVLMEHRLSQSTRKCFPYTLPRLMNKPLTLTFLEMQDVSMKHPSERVMACKPRYTFLTQEDYQVFQTDVRARELVHEFHISSISHKSSRGADAHNECVKVWGPPASSVDRSISFPAVFSSGTKNYEFPLKWFNAFRSRNTGQLEQCAVALRCQLAFHVLNHLVVVTFELPGTGSVKCAICARLRSHDPDRTAPASRRCHGQVHTSHGQACGSI
jgi:hypothetical protein